MLFPLILIYQFLFCSPNRSYTFDFIIHRTLNDTNNPSLKSKLELTTPFCFGRSSTCIPFFIIPDSLYTWIENSTYIKHHRRKVSGDPHSEDYGQFYVHNELFYESYLFEDVFQLDPLSLNKFNIILTQQSKEPQIHAAIGLLRSRSQKYKYISFLEQLYHYKEIDKDQLTIQYINNKAGRITFGELNNGIDKPNKPQSKLLIEMPIQSPLEEPQVFVSADGLFFNDKQINSRFKVNIDESFAFVQFPRSFIPQMDFNYMNILEKYFQLKIKYTPGQNGNYWQHITYYVCDKDNMKAALDVLSDIRFTFGKYNLELKKENMFVEYENGEYIFALIFTESDLNLLKSLWIIGEPILKHYDVEHDFKDQLIRLYEREFPSEVNQYYGNRINHRRSINMLWGGIMIMSVIGLVIQMTNMFLNSKTKQALLN